MAKVNPAWLISKNPGDLKAQIRHAVQFGFHPVSQDATTAHLLRKKKFSCLFATLSFLCFGIGFFVYLFYYLAKRDDEIYLDLTTQPKGEELKAYVAKDFSKKRNNAIAIIGFLFFIFFVIPAIATFFSQLQSVQTEESAVEIDPVFDVPSLLDKNINEIKLALGTPKYDTEPTKLQISMGVTEWDKTWNKDRASLIVTYDFKTKNVIDFFISDISEGATRNKNLLLNLGGLNNNQTQYQLKFVEVVNPPTPGLYTGVIVTPR